MSLFLLYFVLVILPNLGGLNILAFLSIIMGGIVLIAHTIAMGVGAGADNHEAKNFAIAIKPITSKLLRFGIILAFVLTVVPSQKQIYTVAGAYIVTNTQDIAKLPDNLVKAANDWLKDFYENTKTEQNLKSSQSGNNT